MPLTRLDVLRRICARIKPRRYLEYGLRGGCCLAQVTCPVRWGVDAHPSPGHAAGTELSAGVTLAAFAERHPSEKFDLILLNAAHGHREALRDIDLALNMLGDDGVLLVHNCNPTTEAMQVWPPIQGECTGDVWRAIVELRARPTLTIGVIPDDYGIGLILKRPSSTPGVMAKGDITYAQFAAQRQNLLNLIPPARWERWFVENFGGHFPLTLGVPTLFRYDLLTQMLRSAKEGSIVPDRWHICDNGGGKARPHVERLNLPGEVVITAPARNLGVAASWNLMIDAVPDEIILMNDDIVLHPETVECMLGNSAPLVCGYAFGCFLQRPEATSLFGYYDENFYPACWEDMDYQYRMHVAGHAPALVCGRSTHFTSSTTATLLNISHQRLGDYYAAKWGGPFNGSAPFTTERFRIPFDGKPPATWQLRPIHAGATPYVGW